jgi:UDP-N-acetylmuramoyl-L-alanyl-D-glutamate--2,6-diaminopimelate ligase
MRLGDLATAELSLAEGDGSLEIAGLSADSRAVERGFLFAALPGSSTDGARFIADAVARGAAAVLLGEDARVDAVAGVSVIRAADPRLALARLAARFYPRQPERLVAVTGTSGKTSVAAFARQIFAAAGYEAASIGTLGIVSEPWTEYGSLTTPDPVALHRDLDRLAAAGVTAAAIEASSHGLDQRRLDGLRIRAAGFTNLGRDHMDYHPTVEAYLDAKRRLFSAILPPDGTAVVDLDDPHGASIAETAKSRGQRLVRVGRAGSELKVVALTPKGFKLRMTVDAFGKRREVLLPLAGAFQASNALIAAGLAIGAGVDVDTALASLEDLVGAPGRLELAGRKANGAMIFVDYAHKPDALKSALQALRPMTAGKLIVVFGAGGDRDAGKRPLMGEAAAAWADVVIVTDDNPRSEDPAAIRKAILAGAPGAIEIGDRGEAIARAIAMLEPGDVLCIAGKGHETGQIVSGRTIPFSDHAVVKQVLAREAA